MITAHKTLDIFIGDQHISVKQTFNIPNTNNTHKSMHKDIKRRLNLQIACYPSTPEYFVFQFAIQKQ